MTGLHDAATTRRRIVQTGLAMAGTIGVIGRALAGDTASAPNAAEPSAPTRFTPEAVQYQPTPKDWQKCVFCTYFQAPDTCWILTEKVSPQGWCTRFALLHE